MGQVTNKASQPDWPKVWAAARERLRKDLGDAVFDAWIGPLVLVSAERGDLNIGAPKPFARNWVANHYMSRIERALRASGGEPASLTIALAPSVPTPAIGASAERATVTDVPPPQPGFVRTPGETAPAPRRGLANRLLHPAQTFESFVPGQATEFAYRASRALAEGETSDIGLLYIHGGFGFGKTHLLNATALEAKKRGRRPLFLGAEDFMRQFLGALHRKDTLAFKDELRGADLLLIDDLQHICRSSATISEFLHTVNAFADQRRRVVIAADRPPTALDSLGRRCALAPLRRAGHCARQAGPRHPPVDPQGARRRVRAAAAGRDPAPGCARTDRRDGGRQPRAT